MFSIHGAMRRWFSAMTACGALAGTALAGDRIDADIDTLQADLYHDAPGWLLKVRYSVEVEDACRGERFLLSMTLTEDGCALLDEFGRPITLTVPLMRTIERDGDERTLAGCTDVQLPPRSIRDPDDVEIEAIVAREGGSRVLDREDCDVDFRGSCGPAVEIHQPRPVFVTQPAPIVLRQPQTIIVRDTRPVVVREVRPAPIVVRPAPIVVREPRPIVVRQPTRIIERREPRSGVHVNVGVRF